MSHGSQGGNSSNTGAGGCLSSIMLPLVFGIIGYFVYGRVFDAVLAIFLYALGLSVISYLGLIPVVGPIIYLLLAKLFSDWALAALALSATTLTVFIFWFYFAIAVLITILVIAIATNASNGRL